MDSGWYELSLHPHLLTHHDWISIKSVSSELLRTILNMRSPPVSLASLASQLQSVVNQLQAIPIVTASATS
jgi:hypothetical protein